MGVPFFRWLLWIANEVVPDLHLTESASLIFKVGLNAQILSTK